MKQEIMSYIYTFRATNQTWFENGTIFPIFWLNEVRMELYLLTDVNYDGIIVI